MHLLLTLILIMDTRAHASFLRDCAAALRAQAAAQPLPKNQISNPVLYNLRNIRAALQTKYAAHPPEVREIPEYRGSDIEEFLEWIKDHANPTEQEWEFSRLRQDIVHLEELETDVVSTSIQHVVQTIQLRGRPAIENYLKSLQTDFVELTARAIAQHRPWIRPKKSRNPVQLYLNWRDRRPSPQLVENFSFLYQRSVADSPVTFEIANQLNSYWDGGDLSHAYKHMRVWVGPKFYYAFSGDLYLSRLQYDPLTQSLGKDQFLEKERVAAMTDELNTLRAFLEEMQEGRAATSHPELEARRQTGSVEAEFDFIAGIDHEEPVLHVILRAGRKTLGGRSRKRRQTEDAKEDQTHWSGAAQPAPSY